MKAIHKRMISLFLAVVMMVTFFTVSASASFDGSDETEEVAAEAMDEQAPSAENDGYTISIVDTNGNIAEISGGTEAVISEILNALGYEISEDTSVEVDPNSIDEQVIDVTDTENTPVLTDNESFEVGPDSIAEQAIIETDEENAPVLTDNDSFEVDSDSIDEQAIIETDEENTPVLTDNDSFEVDSDSIDEQVIIETDTENNPVLTDNDSFEVDPDSIDEQVIIEAGTENAPVLMDDESITIEGQDLVVYVDDEPYELRLVNPPEGYTTDENGNVAYKISESDNRVDFKGFVNDAWQQVTFGNNGFKAGVYNGDGITISEPTVNFLADGKAIELTYTLTADGEVQNYRFYIAADTTVAGNDASTNSSDGDGVVTMTDEKTGVSLFVFSSTEGGTAVPTEYSNSYCDVSYSDVTTRGKDPSTVTPVSSAHDSAFVMYFPLKDLSAGGQERYVFIVGMGAVDEVEEIIKAVKEAVEASEQPEENVTEQPVERQLTVPVKDGNTIKIMATVIGKTVEVAPISAEDISAVLNSEDATKQITIDCSAINGVEVTKVNIQLNSLGKIISSEATAMKVAMSNGSVTMDKNAMTFVAGNASGYAVSLVMENVSEAKLNEAQSETVKAEEKLVGVMDTYILNGTSKLRELGNGKATLTVSPEYIQNYDPATLHIFEIMADGTKQEVSFSVVDGEIVFDVDHLGIYMIVSD